MAKLAGLLKKIKDLATRLDACREAYLELLDEHTKLKIKYSYEETMGVVKDFSEKQRIEGKNLL